MPVAEEMTLDSPSTSTLDDEAFVYRPIPVLVPISLAFVFLSFLSAMLAEVLVVPVVGVLLATVAARQIDRSGGSLSGKGLARVSLGIQLAMLLGFAALHAYSFASELPPGFERVNFTADIAKKGFSSQNG